MTEVYKIHEKNKSLFAKSESTAGTYNAPAATDALPCISVDGSVTNDTGSYTYLGDSLSRDEFSFLKDSYAEFSAETPLQVLTTLDAAIAVADVPMQQWFQACGGYVTVFGSALGSIPAGAAIIDNSRVSDTPISVDYRKSTPLDTVNNKLWKFVKCRGTVDISVAVSDVPKVKFNMKGNSSSPLQATILTPSFGTQFTDVAATVSKDTLVTAEVASSEDTFTTFGGTVSTITKSGNIATLTTSAAHSLGSNGSIRFITIAGATDALYNGLFLAKIISTTKVIYWMTAVPASNASGTFAMTYGQAAKTFCISTLSASNFFGFDFQRYLTGCEVGFSKISVPTDVSATILEGAAPTTTITAISSTTTTATVTAAAHGLSTGNVVDITETDANYNITSATVTVTDANTFTYAITSYNGSFSGLGRVTNKSFATFDPDSHISKFFGVQLKFGIGAGEYTTLMWDKLQVKDVKEDKVNSYLGRNITFRNTGRSWIILE